jgi:meso-butanediol dehydrogenase/(S,S)-butanediol dehydrogenase/diacetyl reductase
MTEAQQERFGGEVVVVTGGAAGIGRAIAERFLAEGAIVTIADTNEASIAEARRCMAGFGAARFEGVVCDVRTQADVRRLAAGVMDVQGRIDVLVNNAGVSSVGRVVDLAEEEWQRVMDVNAKGTFLCCQAVLPGMLERKTGAIVNIASQAGKRGQAYIAHYCAAKAAVINFTRALALEAAPYVRVNAVCPGTIVTPMVESTSERQAELMGTSTEALMREALEAIPLGRLQKPEDIAAAVAFLVSGDASEITGQAVNVSGGVLMD